MNLNLSIFFLLAITLSLIRGNDVCSSYDSSCELCLTHYADRQCGWCNTTSSCFTGNTNGPLDGTCSKANWYWGANSQCPPNPAPTPTTTPTPTATPTPTPTPIKNECTKYYKDCATCSAHFADRSCGWCISDQTCYDGSDSGPNGAICTGMSWVYGKNSKCTTDLGCGVYNNSCDSCLTHYADRQCGWCKTTSSCFTGNTDGPLDSTCSQDNWYWGANSQCPPNPAPKPTTIPTPTPTPTPIPTPDSDDCAIYPDCNRCAAHYADRNCGWCASDKKCYQGTKSGSSNGKCKGVNWNYGSNAKCLSSECNNYDSCDVCLTHFADRKCGWCTVDGLSYHCLSGDGMGATSMNCTDNWYYGPNAKCTGPAPSPTVYPSPTPSPTITPSPFPKDECTKYFDNCYTCLTHYADRKCGWCSDTKKCFSGNASNPIDGSCSSKDWLWGPTKSCQKPVPTTSPTKKPSSTPKNHKLSSGAIAGIAVGSAAGAIILIVIIVVIVRKNNKQKQGYTQIQTKGQEGSINYIKSEDDLLSGDFNSDEDDYSDSDLV
ncbi:hypothetical protein M0813_28740 [Anaeramoeba flamelloides]|uniref:PSI domain-containing protein n=1 Tax=Anaeramoeba flamelloides TaxID=1746091 RepID=A0ABQ8XRR0_9EUKA|nr:hypothetical protein M0813_28740 [Anaeramoeba flamelloides]